MGASTSEPKGDTASTTAVADTANNAGSITASTASIVENLEDDSQPRFYRFRDLPIELRNQIYRNVVTVGVTLFRNQPPELMRVSKQFYAEVGEEYFGSNTFKLVDRQGTFTRAALRQLRQKSGPYAIKAIKIMRRVRYSQPAFGERIIYLSFTVRLTEHNTVKLDAESPEKLCLMYQTLVPRPPQFVHGTWFNANPHFNPLIHAVGHPAVQPPITAPVPAPIQTHNQIVVHAPIHSSDNTPAKTPTLFNYNPNRELCLCQLQDMAHNITPSRQAVLDFLDRYHAYIYSGKHEHDMDVCETCHAGSSP